VGGGSVFFWGRWGGGGGLWVGCVVVFVRSVWGVGGVVCFFLVGGVLVWGGVGGFFVLCGGWVFFGGFFFFFCVFLVGCVGVVGWRFLFFFFCFCGVGAFFGGCLCVSLWWGCCGFFFCFGPVLCILLTAMSDLEATFRSDFLFLPAHWRQSSYRSPSFPSGQSIRALPFSLVKKMSSLSSGILVLVCIVVLPLCIRHFGSLVREPSPFFFGLVCYRASFPTQTITLP